MQPFLTAAACCIFGQAASANDPEAERRSQFLREAALYGLTRVEDNLSLKLHRTPVLHWHNPVRFGDDGAVFVWLHHRRPEAIGTVFTYFDEPMRRVRMLHEFHSLSLTALEAVYDGHLVWHPNQAGIQLKPIRNAPAPVESGSLRLAQMRALARRFSGTSLDFAGRQWELRLMPQPLFRYSSAPLDLIDGALFSFVVGTDPEVLLVIEARRAKNARQWQYGLARFSDSQMSMRYQERPVWRVPSAPALASDILANESYRKRSYVCFFPEWLR